jgi:polyisoprenyl-teichoic acid--peptidoglycan teichoic acid transferase
VLRNFTELAAASTSLIRTDIPQAELPKLIDLAWRAKDRPITSLQLTPPLITPADPDLDVITDELERAMDASVNAAAERNAASAATAADSNAPPPVEPTAAGAEDNAEPAVDLSSVCAYE